MKISKSKLKNLIREEYSRSLILYFCQGSGPGNLSNESKATKFDGKTNPSLKIED